MIPIRGLKGMRNQDKITAKIQAALEGIPKHHLVGLVAISLVDGKDLPSLLFGDAISEYSFGVVELRRDVPMAYAASDLKYVIHHEVGHHVSRKIAPRLVSGGRSTLHRVAQEYAHLSQYGRVRKRDEEVWADLYAMRLRGILTKVNPRASKVFGELGM